MNTLSPGTPLQGGKYRIEEPLAQNDSCITYLATWVDYNLKVCIKEFFMKEFCDRPGNTTFVSHQTTSDGAGFGRATDDQEPRTVGDYQRVFLREARTIARLDHPNIIRIHDRFEENNTAYYVMEFIEGPSLADVIRQHGKMPPEKARSYVRQIGEALHYMHEQGVTHYSVRPSHIMVRSRDDMPILIDFRKARHDGDRSRPFNPASDVYALAETLEELITGQIPAMLPDVPDNVIDFLHVSGCIKQPVIEEVADVRGMADGQLSGTTLDAESRIRILSASAVAAEASQAEARKQEQSGVRTGQPGVARSYMPSGLKAKAVQPTPVKTEAEKQKEKYNAVSQQYARNMARNNQNGSGGIGFGAVLMILVALVIVVYYLLK